MWGLHSACRRSVPGGFRRCPTSSWRKVAATAELARLKKGLAARSTEIVPITPTVSLRAAALIDELALSHGMRLADALIGATAIELQEPLLTANVKHFSPVAGLQIEPFIP
jgi:predicted nucleic acid-binding protein